ncbi:MAG: type II 3-dehydroquinate dehydratase [Hyphomonadaceae bacterium]|nr:type II 3-dehydroquinate dehydratase [Hyphomonadaceae bacterium]
MASPKPIYVLNGPNLNLLGTREPEIYGRVTLAEIEQACGERAGQLGFGIVCRQSNVEGDLVNWLQEAREAAAAVVLNAGGYSHTSVALHDAIKAISVPVIETHLSNPAAREDFRHASLVGRAARGVIAGFGATSYLLAIEAAALIARESTP